MEDDMFDTHLCLVCNQTIVGLINYIVHKKNQCHGKKQTDIQPDTPHPVAPDNTYQAQITSSSHLQLMSTDQNVVNPSSMLSGLGQRTDKEFSSQLLFPQSHPDTYSQPMQTLSGPTFTSTTAATTLPTSVSESSHYSCQGITPPSSQPNRLFHAPSSQLNTMPSTLSSSLTADPLPPAIASEPLQSALPSISQQNVSASPSLSFSAPDTNQNSHNTLSVEVHSPLSRFINANLSPITGGAVDPNSVMPTTTSGHCEDFFQSLELQSKGAREQKSPSGFGRDSLNHHSKGFDDEDHADIDLPISKILSNLDFSSDEDIVDLPSDDDLDCNFDVYSDDDFDNPPNSHTGGKWKPGEGPHYKPQGKKMKWRLGAGPIRHGGKWKPGMTHGKHGPASKVEQGHASKVEQGHASKGKQAPSSIGKQIDTRNYECKVCDMTFNNRFLYSNHFGSKTHKDTVTAKDSEKSKKMDEEQQEKTGKSKSESDGQGVSPKKQVHVCTVCDKKFHRRYEIAKHLVTNFHRNRAMKHPEAVNMLQKYHQLVLRLSPYQCKLCCFFFNRECDFFNHVDSAEHVSSCSKAVGQLVCVVCKFMANDCKSLNDHVKGMEHRVEMKKCPNLCIIKEYICEIKCKYCGVVMNNRKRMSRHIAYRHPQRQFTKPFIRVKGGHHPECPDCGKICVSPSALIVHIRRNHTKERPFKCDPCGKSFAVLGALSSHVKSRRHENKLKQNAALEVLDQALRGKLSEGINVKQEEEEEKDLVGTQELEHDGIRTEEGVKIADEASSEEEDENEDDAMVIFDKEDEAFPETDEKKECDFGFESKEKEESIHTNKKIILRKRKKKKVFKCEHCDFACGLYSDLRPHCDEVHPNEVHYCEMCSSTFLSLKAYRIHCSGRYHQEQMERSTETASDLFYKCSICDMKFVDERWRNFHYEYQHNHLNNEASLHEITKGNDKVTKLYGDHLQLLEDLPKNTSLSCPECGKFLKKDHLVEHLRLHTGEKPYTCRFCEKSFVAKLSLRRHLMMHMGLTENTCNICGREFKKLETYRNHMEQHSSEKEGSKCICDVCGMVFTLKKQVEAHMKRHGERKHKCPIDGCTWTFVMRHELKMHMLTHTKEKKFLCDICGFGATTKNRLQRHVKTHSGIRDHHCMYCTYKAGCSTHLRRHMRIHIGSKPFKCPYCPYTCNTHENVRKHIAKTKKHQGLKIYPCKFCEFGTNTGKEFRDHLLTSHPDEVTGEKLDSLSVFSGLYVRGDDPSQPQEGTKIVHVKERQPKPQRNAIMQSIKNVRLTNQNADIQGAAAVISEAANHVPRQPICNIESYWSNDTGSNRNHWFQASDATNAITALTSDPSNLYAQPVSTSENCFLVNVAHGGINSSSTSYHEGSVANVVVVSSDF
ncbi:zinc finger protein 62 homolog [Haliotis cracherodii]|uniref:zinc finger protein 62 homolog n=1 Tax=Haliotis cracherodii TaxID=6455 RepID=UPI0039E8109B